MADVRYIKFGDSGAPKVKFDSSFTDDDIRNYLKSEKFENEMASQGYMYKYGLDPVNLLDEDNLDDNAFQAGAKSSVDTLKQFWASGLASMYDVFGAEEKQMEAVEAVRQYQLDQSAHLWRKDKEGTVKPRINSLEQVFESEEEFSAFLEWVGAKMGEGAVTTLPIVLATMVTGGLGTAAIGGGLVARKAGMTAMQQAFKYGLLGDMTGGFTAQTLARLTSMGGLGLTTSAYGMAIGDIYGQQLEETDDPNAGIALALGIPYAAAEGAFGAGSMLMANIIGKVGRKKAIQTVADFLKNNKRYNLKTILKGATRGDRLRALGQGVGGTMAGEATAEAMQETITQTGQELQAGRSLQELYASTDFWKQLGEAAAAGAVGGGPFGVVGGTAQALRVGPTTDVHLDAGGQRITIPKINNDIRNNTKLWKDLKYRIGDKVTITGAPTEGVIGPQQQPDGTSYDQSDPNNSSFPIYSVIGDTNIDGEDFVLLEGLSGKGDLFVPATRAQSIMRIEDGTINANKYNNAAGFNYSQEESDDVNLLDKATINTYKLNKKTLHKRGFLKKNDDKSVEEALKDHKEDWIKEEVKDITNQRNDQRLKESNHVSFTENHQPREERYQQFFEDQDFENGNEIDLQQSYDDFGGQVDGRYEKYNTTDDANLNEAVVKQGWEQERYRKIQGINDIKENYISSTEQKQLKELGFRGPYGEQYIDNLIGDTVVEENPNGSMQKVTRGRKRLNDILENKITFAVETKGKREVNEKITVGQNIVEPLTPAQRVSELGEGIYDETPGDRLRKLKELLHLLDSTGWKWITAQEKKLKKQYQQEKRAQIFASNFTKANAIQKQIDRIDQKRHIIMHEGRIVGTYSPTARRAALEEITRLKKQKENPSTVEMITMYETHVSNIDKARVSFNETLKTFNEEPYAEPTSEKEWNKLTNRHGGLKRIEEKSRNFSFSKPITITRRWEKYADTAGEPRIREPFAENAPKVLQTLKDIVSKLSLDIRVDLHEFLEKDNIALGGMYILGERGVHVAYNVVPVLRPNLDTQDSINYALHHEVMHFLRENQFFFKKEWDSLSKAATDTWIKQYKIKKRYPDADHYQQIEEAISEAFADYMTGRYEAGGLIAKAFERLKQYLMALGNALTRNRFNTPASIFNAIDLGLIGARNDSRQRTSDIYLRGSNINDIISRNQPWAPGNLSGFAPATRALFMDQPNITNEKAFYKWWNSGDQSSVVVDDKDAPLIVMHATIDNRKIEDRVPFDVFDIDKTNDFGQHFTADQTTIDTYIANKDGVRSDFYVFRGFINIKNPLRIPDFGTWQPNVVLAWLLKNNIITQSEFDREMKVITDFETGNEASVESLRQMGLYHGLTESFEAVRKLIQSKGYDGLVYKNEGEYKHKALLRNAAQYLANKALGVQDPSVVAPTAEEQQLLINEPIADSYVIFKPNQFKSIFNAGAYDINRPDMMASDTYQAVPDEKPVDRFKPKNRQQERALDSKTTKEMNEEKKTWSKDNSTMDMPKLARWSRIIGFVREWAIDNPLFERVWSTIEKLGIKAKRIQATFHAMMRNYNGLIKDPIMREMIYRAQIISQYYPNQKFRRDAEGRIIFRAPMDIKPEDSPEGIEIQAGEMIILDGDAALAYEQYQAAMLFIGREQIKGMIAGGYLDQLKEAINIINFHKGRAISEVYVPNLTDAQGNEIKTDQQIEELTYEQVQGIVGALRRLLENSAFDADFMDRSALTQMELNRITNLLGVDPVSQIPKKAKKKNKLGVGLLSLQNQMRQFEEFRLGGDYVPLMRFGNYSITIVDTSEEQYISAQPTDQGAMEVKGKVVKLNPKYILRRQHFETEREAEEGRTRYMNQYRDQTDVEVRGVVEVTADNVKEQLAKGSIDMMDVARFLSDPKQEIFAELEQELRALIKNNKNIIGFDQFMTPRQRVGGIPGYSADFGRAASQFSFLGSRYAARSRFQNEADARKKILDDAIKENPQKYKQLKIGVDKWWDYSQDPYQEFAGIRRVGFWWYLGGNLSSAFLQIFSAIQFTGPILSQISNTGRAGIELTKALKEATAMLSWTNNEYGDVFIDWTKVPSDVKQAILNDMPHYIKQGMALQETGQVPGKEGFNEKTALRQFEQMIIGGPFNTMEAISRLTGYIASYRLAQDPKVREKFYELYSANQIVQGMINDNDGVLSPEIIARTMIDETFGVYGKINRPQIMRGYMAVPALFQTYIGQMFALTFRMLTSGKTPAQKAAGRKVFAKMMLMIALTGGVFGLPGSDDAEELANWMIEHAPVVGTGLKTDMRAAMREMLYDAGFSAGMINAMENGIIEAGLNVDVQRRLSLGNFPGSQQVRAIAGLLGLSPGGNAADFAGAPGSVFMTAIREGTQAIREGESLVDVAFKSSPLFIRNMYKAYDQTLGKGFVETNFGTVIADDAGTIETLFQAIGFGSSRMKRSREALWQERLNATRNAGKKKKINAQITNAYRDIFVGGNVNDSRLMSKGQENLDRLYRELVKWNSKQDIQNQIFPDLTALVQQALEATYADIRLTSTDKLNIMKNLKQRKALGQ